MLDLQFIGLNVHFAVYLLTALVAMAVFWLIFDAWLVKHELKETLKWAGFLLLALGFMGGAAAPETGSASSAIIGYIAGFIRLLGYGAIIAGQLLDPIMARPQLPPEPIAPTPATASEVASSESKSKAKTKPEAGAVMAASSPLAPILGVLLALGAGTVAGLYFRRATIGLERHLRPVAVGFAWIALAELLSATGVLVLSRNPVISQIAAPFGPIWWVSIASLAIGASVLGRWVWYYLTKRLASELFMFLVAQTVVVFLVATMGFTFMLLKNVRVAILNDLSTASNVLQYSLASRQAETQAQAKAAASAQTVAAVAAHDRVGLAAALADTYKQEAFSSLTVTDNTGVVLLRSQDPDRRGDSVSSDPLVRRAVIGQTASNVVVTQGVVAPDVSLVAASPVRDNSGHVIGTISVGRAISNAFVDKIRSSTNLESTVYGGDVRAATTLTVPGTADRAIGISESQPDIVAAVLKKNKNYTGVVSMQNRTYLTSLAPLRDVNNQPVGMLQVAKPTDDLYATASQSLELTFFAAVALILIGIFPIYRLSQFIERQLR